MELVKINPKEFGLTDETAKTIQMQFAPMLEKMVELESEFNDVMAMSDDDPDKPKIAKEVRLKYVKTRTGTVEIHKAQKAFYLNGGRYVDGWKNTQLFASQNKEEQLETIENKAENLKKERIEALNNERVELLRPYVDDTTILNLGDMQDDVFNAYLTAKKKDFYDKIEAEKKVEAERIANEKAEAERLEAQRLENLKLKSEAEAREKEIEAERKKELAERMAIEEKARKDREEIEAKYAKERAEAEAKFKIEQEAKAKIEAELKAERDAKIKAENERLEAEKLAKINADKLAKAPVKEKLHAWVDSFEINDSPLNEANPKVSDIMKKFVLFKVWAKSEIENI